MSGRRIMGLVLAVWLGMHPAPTLAQAPGPSAIADPIGGFIAEASRRFGVPAPWIRAVMRVESAGDPRATSHAGAMGLMQVMPATYAELRGRLGLGPDPYDPRDNILAGAAYLRQMHDRFGLAGMLPAYNAGPGRYETHLATGRPLPAETRDYVARLSSIVGMEPPERGAVPLPPDWRQAGLFIARPDDPSSADETPQTEPTATGHASDRLFVPRSDRAPR